MAMNPMLYSAGAYQRTPSDVYSQTLTQSTRRSQDFDGVEGHGGTQSGRKPKRFKIINDPIHGHMEFPSDLLRVIDTVEFQRLRDLRQLGAARWVFPGAVHDRFSHSLGVAHLARQVIKTLKAKQPALGITDRDCLLVSLAGLCHDLGHGPFSHAFEEVVATVLAAERERGRAVPARWSHEDASERLLDRVLERICREHGASAGLTTDEVVFVKAMIRGVDQRSDGAYPCGKPLFFFQIVANRQTGMDVDKYDYLCRDSRFAACNISFDMARLLRPVVRTDRRGDLVLAYYRKEEWMVHQLFQSRFDMHHQVYGHPAVVAITLMLQDVVLLARDWLRIADAVTDASVYVRLTDAVVHHISWLDPDAPPPGFPQEDLRQAQHLLKRIKRRELYKSLVMQDFRLPTSEGGSRADARAALLAALFAADPGLEQLRDSFVVYVGDRDFTRKNENPLLVVPFYDSRDDDRAGGPGPCYQLRRRDLEYTTMARQEFIERYVRIYLKEGRGAEAEALARRLLAATERIGRAERRGDGAGADAAECGGGAAAGDDARCGHSDGEADPALGDESLTPMLSPLAFAAVASPRFSQRSRRSVFPVGQCPRPLAPHPAGSGRKNTPPPDAAAEPVLSGPAAGTPQAPPRLHAASPLLPGAALSAPLPPAAPADATPRDAPAVQLP